MRRQRLKRIISAGAFCVISFSFVLVLAVILTSGGGGGTAAAAPSRNNLSVPLPVATIGSLGAMNSVGGMPAVNAFATRQLPAALHVHATLSHELQLRAPQTRLVLSFPSLSGGYVTTPVFIAGTEEAATQDSSSVPVGPIILLGSAAGWAYLALSGQFDSDKVLPGSVNPQGTPPTSGPTQTDPSNPGATQPGNNPPGSNPPGNPGSPGGNNPGNPGGNNPGNPGGNNPGNPGGNNPGNPGGNNPGNPGGDNPGNPQGDNPGGNPTGNNPNPPGGNNPDNPGGDGKPNGDVLPLPGVLPGDDLPTTTTPEPVSTVLVGSGLAAIAALRRKRKPKK